MNFFTSLICEAVKISSDFTLCEDESGPYAVEIFSIAEQVEWDLFIESIYLDALAAELTKMVDEVHKCRYEVFANAADTAVKDMATGQLISHCFGKDRTMNTLQAIIKFQQETGILNG